MGIGEVIITEYGPEKVVGFEWGVPVTEAVQDWPQLERLPLNGEQEPASQDALFSAVAATRGLALVTEGREGR